MIWFQIPSGTRGVSLLQNVETSTEQHPFYKAWEWLLTSLSLRNMQGDNFSYFTVHTCRLEVGLERGSETDI